MMTAQPAIMPAPTGNVAMPARRPMPMNPQMQRAALIQAIQQRGQNTTMPAPMPAARPMY